MIQYLEVEEVAERLKLTPWTVRDMARKQELNGIKVRRKWRFDPAKNQRILEKQQSI